VARDRGYKIEPGSVTTPKGFQAAGVNCGIKERDPDLAVILSDRDASLAAMFTTNRVPAAPVLLSRERARSGCARALVINSGNANACTGEQGFRHAEEMTERTASVLNLAPESVLVASTGIIGVPLPMDRIRRGIPIACSALSAGGGESAARAIMTTDTRPKHCSVHFELNGKRCCIGAIAKGSGMINPRLATMIAIFTTDVAVDSRLLSLILRNCVEESLNALTIDAETSTNDAVFLLANGAAGALAIGRRSAARQVFTRALYDLAIEVTRSLARDAEGATRLIQVKITGARTRREAVTAAEAIANSMLVKTAVYGRDPNWGRVVSAVGGSGVALRPERLRVDFAGLNVAKNGCAVEYDRRSMADALAAETVTLEVDLGTGSGQASVITCDLTHEYITINAEYST